MTHTHTHTHVRALRSAKSQSKVSAGYFSAVTITNQNAARVLLHSAQNKVQKLQHFHFAS